MFGVTTAAFMRDDGGTESEEGTTTMDLAARMDEEESQTHVR